MLAYYRSLREKSGLTHEEAIRDSIVSVLMSPKFCYRDLSTHADGATQPSADAQARFAASTKRRTRRLARYLPATRSPAG